MICLELHLTCTWSWEINHRNINHLSVKHWAWGAVELSCGGFYNYLCTKAVLLRRVKESCLCMMKFLSQTKLNYFSLGFWRFFFPGISTGFTLLDFGFLFYFFFFSIYTYPSLYSRQEQEGDSCGMTEILTQTRSARIVKRNISKIWNPSLLFQIVCTPWISL